MSEREIRRGSEVQGSQVTKGLAGDKDFGFYAE